MRFRFVFNTALRRPAFSLFCAVLSKKKKKRKREKRKENGMKKITAILLASALFLLGGCKTGNEVAAPPTAATEATPAVERISPTAATEAKVPEAETILLTEEEEPATTVGSEDEDAGERGGFMIMPRQPLSGGQLEQDAFLSSNGAYFQRYALSDEPVYFEILRLAPAYWVELESSMEDWLVEGVIMVLEPDAYDINIAEDQAISGRLTYPSYRIRFTTGTNEDTCFHRGLLVVTDSYTFWSNCWAYADYFENHELDVDKWLDSVDCVEGDEMEALGSLSPTVISQDPGFDIDVGIDVDTALIRIMRDTFPEYDMSRTDRKMTAYRFDGYGDVNNEAAMLFSFGTRIDEEDDLSVQGQYAVNAQGRLYQYTDMNGEYAPYDE